MDTLIFACMNTLPLWAFLLACLIAIIVVDGV